MAAPVSGCACHIADTEEEPLLSFSNTSWDKLSDCMSTWATLDGQERTVALQFDRISRDCFGYHRRCYQKFTDKRRIQQAIKRREKGCLRVFPDIVSPVPSPNKLLRSKLKSSAERRSKHLLLHECIICCKNKTVHDKTTFKWKREKLVTCETDAGKLLEAAKLKKDRIILIQIGDLDPVSIEVRYHSSCCKNYTRCLYDTEEKQPRPLSKSFELFCTDVIEERLIANEEIMKMSQLTDTFVKTAADAENIDISGYRNCQLKSRLLTKYSNLEFVQPNSTCCELMLFNTDMNKSVFTVPFTDDDTDCDSDCEMEVR